ncbi:MAG: amidohydrolase, partial [Bacteroidota bacterium]
MPISYARADLPALLVQIRRHLHAHPEVGFQEVHTAKYIRRVLEAFGLETTGPLAGTGQYVEIEGALPGPAIGYRADIDALPIQDLKQTSFASVNDGVAHLCGHDAHTAVAIGVALALHEWRDQLRGRVRIFFQPNEEGMPSGAPKMIDAGVLDGLDAVLAIHVDPTLPVGQFGLKPGPAGAAADAFLVRVKSGHTGHSARPHQTIDTVWVANQIMNTLYQIVGRVQDARNSAVLSVCRLRAGSAFNVIPAEVEFAGTLRCIDYDDQVQLRAQFEHTCRHIADLYGADIDIELNVGSPPVYNDAGLIDLVRSTIHERFSSDAVHDILLPSMGAEDFAHYGRHIPAALIRVGTSSGPLTSYPLHDARFDLDEKALPLAVELMAYSLLRFASH